MSAATQEIIALVFVVSIAAFALRSWWRSRQRQQAAACNGCSKSRPAKPADQPQEVKIPLAIVRSTIKDTQKVKR